MSAKIASRTRSSAAILLPFRLCARTDAYQTIAGNAELALARRFEAPEQQRQQCVDPRGKLRILPFVGMGGMMVAGGGVEHRARRGLGVGDLEGALFDAVGQDVRDLTDQALLVRLH